MTQEPQEIAGKDKNMNLRNALAILRGGNLVEKLVGDFNRQTGSGVLAYNRIDGMIETFSEINKVILQDWKDQNISGGIPGKQVENPDIRAEFRKNIEALFEDGDNHLKSEILDSNGQFIYQEDIAERLAIFYDNMRKTKVFSNGNQLTLDLFLTSLGNSSDFKTTYHSINFNRISQENAVTLHDHNSSVEDLTLVFQNALNPLQTKKLKNKKDGFGVHENKRIYIEGIPFLSYSHEGEECLVTANGGLVKRNEVEEILINEIKSGKQIADYDYSTILKDKVIGYVPNTENLRQEAKTHIDGIKITQGEPAPLVCLDINMLTGLRKDDDKSLKDLIQDYDKKIDILDLAGNEDLKEILSAQISQKNERLKRSLEIAYSRITNIKPQLDAAVKDVFTDKNTVDNDETPKLFVAMGGSGSGKTAVEEVAEASCGKDNYVVASLDEFRKYSDTQALLQSANHHADDYTVVEPIANKLRTLVAKKARDKRINIVYDGTATPYSPRYSDEVENFAAVGYDTQVVGVDGFLVKPEGSEEKYSKPDAIDSVKSRKQRINRTLPWRIVLEKHIHSAEAFLNAIEHKETGKVSLFANDQGIDEHYLMAESFEIKKKDLEIIQGKQESGELADYFKDMIRNNEKSTIKNIAHGDSNKIEGLMARNSNFNEDNVAYQVYKKDGKTRVLCVYDAERLSLFYQKSQFNTAASSKEGLLHKTDKGSFVVQSDNPTPWQTKFEMQQNSSQAGGASLG